MEMRAAPWQPKGATRAFHADPAGGARPIHGIGERDPERPETVQ